MGNKPGNNDWKSFGAAPNAPSQPIPKPRYSKKTHEPCKSGPHHRQETITLADGFEFFSDCELAPLLRELNAAGVATYSHCAGHTLDAPAWIVLNLENLDLEIRPANAMGNGVLRPAQVILRWSPPWSRKP
ncbi:hypothetical protein [uncultured Ruegeria sp.]|uniref:hypothetical protein n=1 Tax=uncultured Ruegeria sp. TaxID=259304 RepID=UPI00262DCCC2|nr:hypothetical protein [uncultured Ruegeria sp.]